MAPVLCSGEENIKGDKGPVEYFLDKDPREKNGKELM